MNELRGEVLADPRIRDLPALVGRDKESSLEEILLDLRQGADESATQAHDAVLDASLCLLWKKHQMMPDLPEAYSRFARIAGDSAGVVSLNWDLVCELALYTADIKWSYSTDRGTPIVKPRRFDQSDQSSANTKAEMGKRQRVRTRSTTNDPSPTALMIPFETLSSDTRIVISST